MKKITLILIFAISIYSLCGRAQDSSVPVGSDQSAVESYKIDPSKIDHKLSVRSNLLYWIGGAPNIGVEYRLTESLGVVVDGAWSHWNSSTDDHKHRMFLVNPEVRYFFGESKRLYAGAEFHFGEFNMKFSKTGYQGDIIGGGATLGYQIRLSDTFDLDFNLGLGYTSFKYDSYSREEGVSYKETLGQTRKIYGPTKAGVTLVWKIK